MLAAYMWLYDSNKAVRNTFKNLRRNLTGLPAFLIVGGIGLVRFAGRPNTYKPRHAK